MPYTYDITTYPDLDDQIVASKPTKKQIKKAKSKEGITKKLCFYQKVIVHEHIHHNEMKSSEHDSYWFQEKEYAKTRAEVEQTVTMMETRRFSSGGGADDDSSSFCSRGLEGRTRSGARQVHKARTEARAVVCNEQTRQWSDITRTALNIEALARVYRSKTETSAIVARRVGIRDEEYVKESYFPGMHTTSTTKRTTTFFNFPSRSTQRRPTTAMSRQTTRN